MVTIRSHLAVVVLIFMLLRCPAWGLTQPVAEKTDRAHNILIISLCSWRYSQLPFYGYSEMTMPSLNSWLESGGFLFLNAFNPTSWINPNEYVTKLDPRYFQNDGYEAIGEHFSNRFLRIPPPPKASKNNFEWNEMEFGDGFEKLKIKLMQKRSRPFFVQVHLKYMHFPVYDNINKDFNPEVFFTGKEKKYWRSLIKNKEKASWPFSFHAMVFRDPKWAFTNVAVRAKMGSENSLSPFGIMNDRDLIKKWKNHKDYKLQLSIIKKLYDAKLKFLDEKLKPLLDLYGGPELKKNTIVIVTGDHGEAMMEHDYLIHGETVYDEVHRFPLIIKFPFQTKKQIISDQVSLKLFKPLLEGIFKNPTNPEVAVKLATEDIENKKIILRNCAGHVFGLRFENKYKFILESATRTRKLFDLVGDPLESKNIILKNKDLGATLETILKSSDLNFKTMLHATCSEN